MLKVISKKALILLFFSMICSKSIFLNAEEVQENGYDTSNDKIQLDAEFIKTAEFEITEEGYLKFESETSKIRSKQLDEVDADYKKEVVILVPSEEEKTMDYIEVIEKIKNDNGNSYECQDFLNSLILENQQPNDINLLTEGSSSRNTDEWDCKASITIYFDEITVLGRKSILLKKVTTKVTTGNDVIVDSRNLNYGCSGTSSKGGVTQNETKSWGMILSNLPSSTTTDCPSTWVYVYQEKNTATVGANLTVKFRINATSLAISHKTITLMNNLAF